MPVTAARLVPTDQRPIASRPARPPSPAPTPAGDVQVEQAAPDPLVDVAAECGALAGALEGLTLDARLRLDHFTSANRRAVFRLLAGLPQPVTPESIARRLREQADANRPPGLGKHVTTAADEQAFWLARECDEIRDGWPAAVGTWAVRRLDGLARRRALLAHLATASALTRHDGTIGDVRAELQRALRALEAA